MQLAKLKASDKIAVCLFATGDYAFSVATACQGLLEHNQDFDFKFYVMHDNMSKNDQLVLASLLGEIEFVAFNADLFHNLAKKYLTHNYNSDKISDLLLKRKSYFIGKIISLSLLERHDKVLYLDTDLLINGSLGDVFKLKGASWRNSKDNAYLKLGNAFRQEDYFKVIPKDYPAPNAGVMFFTSDINYNGMLKECFWVLQEYHNLLRADLDEAVIAWATYKNNVVQNGIDCIYNDWLYSSNKETVIYHAIGKVNFWTANFRRIIFHKWEEYYQKWLSLGGTPFVQEVEDSQYLASADEDGKLARFFENTLFWEKVYDKVGETLPDALYRAGPICRDYSQLFIKGVSKKIHFELQISNLGRYHDANILFFVKSNKFFDCEMFGRLIIALESTGFRVLERKDFFVIKSKKAYFLDGLAVSLQELFEVFGNLQINFNEIEKAIS